MGKGEKALEERELKGKRERRKFKQNF